MDAAQVEVDSPRSEGPERSPRRPWLRRIGIAGGVLLTCVLLTALGLTVTVDRAPLNASYAGPAPLPAEVAARFAYPEFGTPAVPHVEWDAEDRGSYSLRKLKLRVTTPGFDPHDVQVIHYRSHEPGRRAAVVVTPILGGSGEVAKAIARSMASNGVHAAIVLRAHSALVGDAPEERLEVVLRTAVIDRRRAVDWLVAQDEVDPQRIGSCGVSMGGLVTSLLGAVEPRIKASVLVLAGGDLADVVATSDQPRVRRYVRERAEHGVAGEVLRERIRAGVPSDPVTLAPYVDARRVLFVAARRDTTVPFAAQERLHEALGGPERITLPTGHYTSAVYLPWLLGQVEEFFARTM